LLRLFQRLAIAGFSVISRRESNEAIPSETNFLDSPVDIKRGNISEPMEQ